MIWNQKPISTNFRGNATIIKNTAFGPIVKLKNQNQRVLLKSYQELGYLTGDYISLSGQIEAIKNTDQTFDVVRYFKTLQTFNVINQSRIKIIKKSNSLPNQLINYVTKGPPDYQKATMLLLLGIKTRDNRQIYNQTKVLNIVHLFVISGFHMNLIFLLLAKLLGWCKINQKIIWILVLFPLLFYLYVLNFPISASRAFLFISFIQFNKAILKDKFKKLDIIAIIMIIMFIYNPYQIFSLSFIFTFISTITILLTNDIKINRKWLKWLIIMIFVYLSNLIIATKINKYISIFGFFYSIIFSPLIIFTYLVTFLFWPFYNLLNFLDIIFIFILKIFYMTSILIKISFINFHLIIFYYIILVTCILFTEQKTISSIARLRK